jgi:hypothetical protein
MMRSIYSRLHSMRNLVDPLSVSQTQSCQTPIIARLQADVHAFNYFLPPPIKTPLALPALPFRASSNRRMMTSHFVSLHSCFADCLTDGANNVRPAAFSTLSTVRGSGARKSQYLSFVGKSSLPGTWNAVNGTSSGITALGRTKAPIEMSLAASVTPPTTDDLEDPPKPKDDEAF